MARFKAVVFDIDHTLIDFIAMKRYAIEHTAWALVDTGLNMTVEEAFNELWKVQLENIESDNWLSEFLKKVQGYETDLQIAAGTKAYQHARDLMQRPYPHTRLTLTKLLKKGVKLGALTDAPSLKGYKRIIGMDFTEFFYEEDGYAIFTPKETGVHKPDPKGFYMVLEKLSVKPYEALMVGDHPVKDIEGARKVGMKTAFAKYGAKGQYRTDLPAFDESQADYVLNDISDLVDIVCQG